MPGLGEAMNYLRSVDASATPLADVRDDVPGAAEDSPLLTPRQTDVVRLAVLGLTAKESARRLGISKNTVDEHLREARLRLGAATKSQLIARAVGFGIVSLG
jgi:DNA-binding CsgD family transcriptional regulator